MLQSFAATDESPDWGEPTKEDLRCLNVQDSNVSTLGLRAGDHDNIERLPAIIPRRRGWAHRGIAPGRWWTATLCGAMISLWAPAFDLVGDGQRDVLDPRTQD